MTLARTVKNLVKLMRKSINIGIVRLITLGRTAGFMSQVKKLNFCANTRNKLSKLLFEYWNLCSAIISSSRAFIFIYWNSGAIDTNDFMVYSRTTL